MSSRALQAAGSLVLLTVTTPEEAVLALRAGPDALVLQGAEAGAHRGSLVNADRPDEDRPVRALLAAVRRRTLVPLVAGGGVAGPDDVADLLARGADLVQAGTAFLRCPESGAPAVLKEALGAASLTANRDHPGLQRPPGPCAGQRHGARTTRERPPPTPRSTTPRGPCAPPPARAGDTGSHEPVRRDGLPRAAARPAAEVVEWLLSGWPR